MTETRHVKLNFEEALDAKKQLLSAELNILQTMKRLKSYKILRKKELIKKNKLKTATSSLKSKLNLILSTFPDEEGKPKITTRKRKRKEEKTQDLSKELAEIEKKLAKLQ